MNEVISTSSAYKMLVMLRAVINEGTGGRVRRLGVKADMGGKTGTTNYNADGWFMGFTPSLVSGCWVGGEDRDIHFDTMLHGQGASMALPIWTKYMNKVYADKWVTTRPRPSNCPRTTIPARTTARCTRRWTNRRPTWGWTTCSTDVPRWSTW